MIFEMDPEGGKEAVKVETSGKCSLVQRTLITEEKVLWIFLADVNVKTCRTQKNLHLNYCSENLCALFLCWNRMCLWLQSEKVVDAQI
jgi:hypothetical protein